MYIMYYYDRKLTKIKARSAPICLPFSSSLFVDLVRNYSTLCVCVYTCVPMFNTACVDRYMLCMCVYMKHACV